MATDEIKADLGDILAKGMNLEVPAGG